MSKGCGEDTARGIVRLLFQSDPDHYELVGLLKPLVRKAVVLKPVYHHLPEPIYYTPAVRGDDEPPPRAYKPKIKPGAVPCGRPGIRRPRLSDEQRALILGRLAERGMQLSAFSHMIAPKRYELVYALRENAEHRACVAAWLLERVLQVLDLPRAPFENLL